MCGIAGVLDRVDRGNADPELASTMAASLQHRGPDGEGNYHWPVDFPKIAISVRRLSVIDLETGDQPIFNEDGSLVIVCNGEIYNHIELRRKLESRGHRFATFSDVEVLLHLYEEYGTDMFQEIRGMYAFGLWDKRRERLMLAVDHLGIKPLYYVDLGDRLVFASEVKALTAAFGLPWNIRFPAIDTFLTFGYMIGDDTMYEGVKRIPAGQALVFEGKNEKMIRHWKMPETLDDRSVGDQPSLDEIRSLLTEAVRLHLRSDVSLGLFLSGGLDSATILAKMSGMQSSPVHTYTVGFDDVSNTEADETNQAAKVAAHFGARHHELRLSADDWWDALLDYVVYHDEPNANPSAISMLPLASRAVEDVKVVLTGFGGDEVFSGYPHHLRLPRMLRIACWLHEEPPKFPSKLIAQSLLPALQRLYPDIRRVHGLSGLTAYLMEAMKVALPPVDLMFSAMSYDGIASSAYMREQLYNPDLLAAGCSGYKEREFCEIYKASEVQDVDLLVRLVILRTWLPANGLLSLDNVTMANSLEARVPYFDPPLLSRLIASGGAVGHRRGKHLLRLAMSEELPPDVLRSRKRPFSTPIREWFDSQFAERVKAILLDPQSLNRKMFKADAIERLVTRHFKRSADHTEMVFRLLLLELWQQSWQERSDRDPRLKGASR